MEMKKMLRTGIVITLVALSAVSCVTNRKVAYLQDMKHATQIELENRFEAVISPYDELDVVISSFDAELARPFNLRNSSSNTFSGTGLGYLVDQEGNIELPVLGVIHAQGLTRLQLQEHVKNLLIAGVALVHDLDGEVCIAINPHEDDTADMILPINKDTLNTLGKTTRDAISAAIKGEKDSFFLNGKEVAAIVNAYMNKQITQLEELKENINKMIVKMKGDISNNEKKAQDASDAWVNSALPVNVEMPSGANGANVHITVNNKDDE